MKKYPAIALLEIDSIAVGIKTGDLMVKKAPISVLKTGTVHNGKYLILIGGSVASVEEAFAEGVLTSSDHLLDKVFLPDIHVQVHDGILGERISCNHDAIGVIETTSVATMIKSTDAGIKGADVDLIEIRLADDIGGKAFSIFGGSLEEVQAAVKIAKNATPKDDHWLSEIIVPNIHNDIATQINSSTSFTDTEFDSLEGGEL